jgi:hypothetical protein
MLLNIWGYMAISLGKVVLSLQISIKLNTQLFCENDNVLEVKNALILRKGKANQLQTRTGPEGSRRLRLPDFKTVGT